MSPFVSVKVTDDQIAEALDIRASRDEQFGNIYLETDSDMRHVGDLGEVVLRDYLQELNCDVHWLTDNVTGQSDFKIGSMDLEVKTVKRKGPPKINYTAQITAQHIKKSTSGYLFLSYEYPTQTMSFLGYSEYVFFLDNSRYYGEGDYVHPYYQIRAGHEIYNIDLNLLYPATSFMEDMSSKFQQN